jgi:hypothetical protein
MSNSLKKVSASSKQKESKSYPKIEKWVKSSYPNAWIYRTTDRFRAGIPDFLGCIEGRLVGIEVKQEGKETRALQEYELTKIAESGGIAFVMYGHAFTEAGSFKEIFDAATESNPPAIVRLGRGPGRRGGEHN